MTEQQVKQVLKEIESFKKFLMKKYNLVEEQ